MDSEDQKLENSTLKRNPIINFLFLLPTLFDSSVLDSTEYMSTSAHESHTDAGQELGARSE